MMKSKCTQLALMALVGLASSLSMQGKYELTLNTDCAAQFGGCTEGDSWTDGCNACTCTDGVPLCDRKMCPTPGNCVPGTTWEQECNTCTCSAMGDKTCTEKFCPGPAGKYTVEFFSGPDGRMTYCQLTTAATGEVLQGGSGYWTAAKKHPAIKVQGQDWGMDIRLDNFKGAEPLWDMELFDGVQGKDITHFQKAGMKDAEFCATLKRLI